MTDPTVDPQPMPRIGQIVAGAAIALIGIGWFLEVAEIADVPWGAGLPAVLMVVGAALVAGSRFGPQSGLVALGIVLSVVIVLSSVAEVVFEVPFGGGIGEKTHVVTGEPGTEYRWGIGKMTVDLTAIETIDEPIAISLAIGELVVILPGSLDVAVDAGAGIGEVVLFGERSSGLDPDVVSGNGPIIIEVDVGLGKAEVRR